MSAQTQRILGMTPQQARDLQDRYAHLLPGRPESFSCTAVDEMDAARDRLSRARSQGHGHGQLVLDLRPPKS